MESKDEWVTFDVVCGGCGTPGTVYPPEWVSQAYQDEEGRSIMAQALAQNRDEDGKWRALRDHEGFFTCSECGNRGSLFGSTN